MSTVIFIACALWFLTANFPETFGFIGIIFTAVWNFVGSIVMFFVGLISKFLSVFVYIGEMFGWLIVKLGILLEPVMEVLPDSPLIPFAAFVLLGVLFWLLRRPGDGIDGRNIESYAKLTYAWCFAAFNLGMIVAGSENPHGWMSGAIDTYITDFPMTMTNYEQWTGFAHTMLVITMLGGLYISIFFASIKGLRSFIRTWVGLAFCGMLGYEYMMVRLEVTYWLADNLGFIGSMLNIPIGLLEFFIIIQFFFGIVVFFLPMGAIKALNEISRENAGRSISTGTTSPIGDIDISSGDSFPTYVTDERGNNYSVSIDGDFIYINLPGGRIGTKWEYVKGQSRFQVEGKWFTAE